MAKQKQPGGPRSFKGALAALVVFVALILIFLWRYSGLATVPAEAPAAQSAAPTATPAPTAAPTPGITPEPTPAPAVAAQGVGGEARQMLDDFLNAQPGSVSVWMQNLVTGASYSYNPSAGFYCASTLKAPYALWLCQRDDAGEIDLDADVGGATGWQRIHAMLSKSSNGAAHALGAAYPGTVETGFSEFLRGLGFASPDGCDVTEEGIHGWVTAADGGKTMQAIYDYTQQETENAGALKAALLAADHELLWAPAPAAKKYGSWDQVLHDMAIVYADEPYILSVFTNWGSADVDFPPEGVEMMQQLGHLAAQAMGADD